MLKYIDYQIVFKEIPDEITLAINISGCPNNCIGCHSQYMKEDIGENLTITSICNMIEDNPGITCICFMGGDKDPEYINILANFCKSIKIKTAWYSGKPYIADEIELYNFDFIKIGPYIEHYGPLNSRTTNQKLFQIDNGNLINITNKF